MGYVHILRDFYSYPEQATRTLRIYTPDAYDQDPDRRFPVLYMCDGQNVFDHPESALFHTWRANVAMEQGVREGAHPPFIIVGLDHLPGRFEEYSPWPFPVRGVEPRGSLFVDCVVHHVRPFIESTYRTLTGPEHTGILGASLGGLISLYAARERPDVFGRVGAVSPTLMWSDFRTFEHWSSRYDTWTKIWLDAGREERIWLDGLELDYAGITERFYWHLKGLGYADHEVTLYLEPGANHHEVDWQRRLPQIFRWLLG